MHPLLAEPRSKITATALAPSPQPLRSFQISAWWVSASSTPYQLGTQTTAAIIGAGTPPKPPTTRPYRPKSSRRRPTPYNTADSAAPQTVEHSEVCHLGAGAVTQSSSRDRRVARGHAGKGHRGSAARERGTQGVRCHGGYGAVGMAQGAERGATACRSAVFSTRRGHRWGCREHCPISKTHRGTTEEPRP